jgi:hypothetical protein
MNPCHLTFQDSGFWCNVLIESLHPDFKQAMPGLFLTCYPADVAFRIQPRGTVEVMGNGNYHPTPPPPTLSMRRVNCMQTIDGLPV